MNRRIRELIWQLRYQGDRGTANAIVDAINITARARRMLRMSIDAIERTPYHDEAQLLQTRIDLLRELLNDNEF